MVELCKSDETYACNTTLNTTEIILESKLKKTLAILLSVSIFSAGCAHRTPNPVQVSQLGDDTKSCRSLLNEMEETKAQIGIADGDGNMQIGKNVLLGVAGAFLIVPWFFMDLGNAATVEQRAAQSRGKRLAAIYEDRNCAKTEKELLEANTPTPVVPVKTEISAK
jgi:hypothetical protein